jgi:Zn-dependent alcohol dehydrogenase
VQVYAAGAGHAEVYAVTGGEPGLRLIGDEAFVRVLEVGDGVTRVAPGDAAIVTPVAADSGGAAEFVLDADDGETAPAAWFTWATNAIIDERHLVKVADVPDREASSIIGSTLATAAAAIRQSGLEPGQSVAVFGASGLGLGLIVAARAAGAGTIVAVDRKEARLALAHELGAGEVVNAPTAAALEAVKAATGGQGADIIFDCVDDYRTKDRPGARAARDGGVAMTVSTAGPEAGPRPNEADVREAYRWIAEGTLVPSRIVTMRYTFEAINEAVRDIENGDYVGSAIIVMEPLR